MENGAADPDDRAVRSSTCAVLMRPRHLAPTRHRSVPRSNTGSQSRVAGRVVALGHTKGQTMPGIMARSRGVLRDARRRRPA